MNVLSLFDGISAGRVALERAGVVVDNYYASEIDKYAIQVSKKNYPDIKQLGDISIWRGWNIDWSSIDMVIGGSPCQGFSIAGRQLNFEDPRSKLFFDFIDICDHVADMNPNMKFLLENVKMKQEFQDVINKYMGVEPIVINSSLLSAQNRVRLYWTNIPNVSQPEDKGIVLSDILDDKVDDRYYLTAEAIDYMSRLRNGKQRWEYHRNPIDGKAACLTANMYKGVPYGVVRLSKCEQIATLEMKGNECIRRVYNEQGKSPCLTTSVGGHRQPKVFDYMKEKARKLTPLECERLQTFPEGHTEGISNTQRYKSLGNSWTVDVIAHIFKQLL
jgi:DNA-cytosine methyltransferase